MLIAAVVAIAGNSVISVVARASGVEDFEPLELAGQGFLTVVGVVIGTAGWAAIRRYHAHPGPLLRRLVPTVLLLSFIPDLLLIPAEALGATVGGVVALMAMHVWVAAVLVLVLVRVLPVRR